MQGWRRPVITSGYVCYILALFTLFVYLKFPSQQVRTMVMMTLSQHHLHHISIGAVDPLFPLGLTFRPVIFSHEWGGQLVELARIAELRTYLRTFSPFGSRLHIRFAGEVYGGSLFGDVTWERDGEEPTVDVRAGVRDVRLGTVPLDVRLGKATLEGKLMGSLTLRLPGSRWQEGEGRLVFQADAGALGELPVLGLRIPALAYDQLSGELALQPGSVMLRDLLLRGRDWQIGARGKVGLAESLPQSLLELTLQVRASEALEKQLAGLGTFLKQRRDRRGFASFRIGGTLGNPTVNP